jgi:hypothetical protein
MKEKEPIAANTDYGKDEDSAEVRIYMYKPFSYFYTVMMGWIAYLLVLH